MNTHMTLLDFRKKLMTQFWVGQMGTWNHSFRSNCTKGVHDCPGTYTVLGPRCPGTSRTFLTKLSLIHALSICTPYSAMCEHRGASTCTGEQPHPVVYGWHYKCLVGLLHVITWLIHVHYCRALEIVHIFFFGGGGGLLVWVRIWEPLSRHPGAPAVSKQLGRWTETVVTLPIWQCSP